MKRSFIVFLALMMVLVFGLVACVDDTSTTTSTTKKPATSSTSSSTTTSTTAAPTQFTVTLQLDANVSTVSGVTSQTVIRGETAVFTLSFAQGYKFASASAGAYDATTGQLTVANVTENMTVSVTSADDRYATVTLTGSIYCKVSDAEGNKLTNRAQTVLKGEDVVFYIEGTSNRGIESVGGGTYDAATGKLTFSNVTEDISCKVNVKKHTIVYHANNGTTNTVVQEPSFTY